ncbi:MAG: ScyD/ScyE family protein [Nocardioidaceae bacterium]
MNRPHLRGRTRLLTAATGTLALVGAAAAAQSPVAAQDAGPLMAPHVVVASGLDNPRQLTVLEGGDFLIAEAGHGGDNPANCIDTDEGEQCIGLTGKVSRIHDGRRTVVMAGMLSGAAKDGTAAVGSDGAGKLPMGPYLAIESIADPDMVPPGLPAEQAGHLLAKFPDGPRHPVADVSAYERNHDPDGEGVDSNPYSVLALDNQTLVADAAADAILSVRGHSVSLWALLPEYGPRVDAVPTVIAKGPGGMIYVGELHSFVQHKAKVWQYDRMGHRLRSWTGFTTVTGVARGADGSLYVSELFGGVCTFQQIPTCFPGRVVKVAPNGTRTHVNVPFPAGIVVRNGLVYVNAFSISPATGFGGNPAWSGQLWRVFP